MTSHPESVTLVGPTHPYKGGIAQHCTALAHHLAEVVPRVDLLSWSAQYPRRFYPGQLELDDPATEDGFPSTRRALAWYDPSSWWRAAGPPTSSDLVVLSVVNAFQIPAYAVILERARRAGAHVVALCHNVEPHDAGANQQRLVRWLLRRVDGVLVHSEDEGRRATAIGAQNVVVSRLPFHFPAVAQERPLSRPLGRVAMIGFIRPYKGADVMIDALARTREPIDATIAGEFWMPVEDLAQRAENLGIRERVELRDEYLDPAALVDLIQQHDAVVLPYRSGTATQQPRVAFLAGRPAIVTRVAGMEQWVSDGVDGLVVAPGSVEELTSALDTLYEPGRLAALLGGVRRPDEGSDWRRYLGALLSSVQMAAPSGS